MAECGIAAVCGYDIGIPCRLQPTRLPKRARQRRRFIIICTEDMKIPEGKAYSNNCDGSMGCFHHGLQSAQENEQASKSERKAFIQLYAILLSLDTAAAAKKKNCSNERKSE